MDAPDDFQRVLMALTPDATQISAQPVPTMGNAVSSDRIGEGDGHQRRDEGAPSGLALSGKAPSMVDAATPGASPILDRASTHAAPLGMADEATSIQAPAVAPLPRTGNQPIAGFAESPSDASPTTGPDGFGDHNLIAPSLDAVPSPSLPAAIGAGDDPAGGSEPEGTVPALADASEPDASARGTADARDAEEASEGTLQPDDREETAEGAAKAPQSAETTSAAPTQADTSGRSPDSSRTALPETVDSGAEGLIRLPDETVRQNMRNIAAAAHTLDDGVVEVTLTPKELGHVTLTLKPHETNGSTVILQADRPETLDLMRRHVEQLAQELRDCGYRDLSFTFQDRRSGDRHPTAILPPRQPHDPGDGAPPAGQPVMDPHRPAPLAAGTLDLRL